MTLWVRLPPRSLNDPVVQWRRRLDDTQEMLVRFQPGSLKRRSVGVPAAHVRGKDGDRVRFPDGPLTKSGWHVPREATDPCKIGVMGSIPIRSTEKHGLMVQRKDTALAWRQSQFDSGWVHLMNFAGAMT